MVSESFAVGVVGMGKNTEIDLKKTTDRDCLLSNTPPSPAWQNLDS